MGGELTAKIIRRSALEEEAGAFKLENKRQSRTEYLRRDLRLYLLFKDKYVTAISLTTHSKTLVSIRSFEVGQETSAHLPRIFRLDYRVSVNVESS